MQSIWSWKSSCREMPDLNLPTPVPRPSYSQARENLVKAIPPRILCLLVCGGVDCRYEGPACWRANQQAIRGLFSSWWGNRLGTLSHPEWIIIQNGWLSILDDYPFWYKWSKALGERNSWWESSWRDSVFHIVLNCGIPVFLNLFNYPTCSFPRVTDDIVAMARPSSNLVEKFNIVEQFHR